MKNTEKSIIFRTSHAMARALLTIENGNYNATFSACLKLYFSDKSAFYAVCKSLDVSTKSLAVCTNDSFDIFKAFSENDAGKIKELLNFAFYYGLKRADAFRTITETINDTISDNYAPRAVDALLSNDVEDVKNDIVVYLLNRAEDVDFLELPNIFKLCKAGNCCVKKHVNRENVRASKTAFSLDAIAEDADADKNAFYADKREFYADIDKADTLEYIISNLPKVHRETARKFLYRYYSNHGKSGIRIDAIAEEIDVSIRTLKSILSEVRALGYENVLNRTCDGVTVKRK